MDSSNSDFGRILGNRILTPFERFFLINWEKNSVKIVVTLVMVKNQEMCLKFFGKLKYILTQIFNTSLKPKFLTQIFNRHF